MGDIGPIKRIVEVPDPTEEPVGVPEPEPAEPDKAPVESPEREPEKVPA